MNMDLSWSHHLRTDAPTLVKGVRGEVKRHMDLISSHMSKFDNVNRALNEGNRVLGNTLCHKCLDAVKSKRMEMQAKNCTSLNKKKLMKLSPECQQIVNEITNVFMKIERSQSENPGNEDYCTQEDYYQQEMAEMQNLHTDTIINIREEIVEMENKYKKEVKDKEAEVRDLRKQLEKMTFEKENCKKDNNQMSKKLKSYEKTESELRELKNNHKRLKEDLDRKECTINKLKRYLELKEEDNRRYRRPSSNFFTRSFAGNRNNELTSLKEVLSSRDEELHVQSSRRENENLKSEPNELLQRNRNLQDETNSLKELIDSTREELQRLRGDNVTLKSEQTELIGSLQEEKHSLKKKLDSTDEELQISRSQTETLKPEQRDVLQRNRNLQEEKNSLRKTTDFRDEELQTSRKEIENRNLPEEKDVLKETKDSTCEELQRSRGDNETLKSEQTDMIGSLQEEKRSFKENQDSTDEELRTSRSQTETLKSDQGDVLQRNRNLQEEENSLRKTTALRVEELQTSRRENENLKSERDELLKRNRNPQKEKNILKETTDSTCEELRRSLEDNETLKSEQKELTERQQKEKRTSKEKLDSTDKELLTSRNQTESLKPEQGDVLQRNRNCYGSLRVEELQTSRRENENVKSERDELLQRNRNPQKEKNVLKETTDSTCEELRRSLEDNETLKSEQKELTERQQKEKRTSKEKLGKHADKSYPEEKEQDEKEISQQRAEIQILQDQACILHKRNAELSSTMENLQRDVTWLIERLERTQGDLDKLKKQNEETVRDISHLQTEKQTLHGQTCSLNKANEVLSTTMEGLQQDIKQLTEESVKKDEEINKLKLSLVDYRRLEKKLLVMRLMCSKQSELDKGIMDMVTKELIRHLEGRIDSNSIEFAIVHCETSTDISNGPLFVLCLNMSREDRYIRDALEETKGGTDVYVLVLHNTNKELTPTRLRVTGSELRQRVIDLAFCNDMGLYDCNLNIEGIEKIVSVLKKF